MMGEKDMCIDLREYHRAFKKSWSLYYVGKKEGLVPSSVIAEFSLQCKKLEEVDNE